MSSLGTIQNYNSDRGFGFISPDSGSRLFFHIKDSPALGLNPTRGSRVSFTVGEDREGRPAAVDVAPIKSEAITGNDSRW
jgi:CspA family cold shock protein